jgi:hypothetical protein
VVNVINILSGVGLLSLPFALKKSGWAGLGVLWLLGFVTNYTGAAPGPGAQRRCARCSGASTLSGRSRLPACGQAPVQCTAGRLEFTASPGRCWCGARRRGLGRGGAGKILVQCYDAVAQRAAAARGGRVAPVGYEDVGEAAFGAFGRAVVASSIYVELLGTGALLFILEARAPGTPHRAPANPRRCRVGA